MESCKRIFSATGGLELEPRGGVARILGQLGWVFCFERIFEHMRVPSGPTTPASYAQSTNLFLSTPEGWRMFWNHASALPLQTPPPAGRLH